MLPMQPYFGFPLSQESFLVRLDGDIHLRHNFVVFFFKKKKKISWFYY
jgi:hypothetical protein